ncbi:MAG: tetratricopeptide repeat protein [Bacteroidetes bacterium]|nr:tetratricopeptide repeat protein [Rhodothermia bacterium]MCX7906119.1 tetratricopeptide repeat protein [Bacteroidota bacterium]MDW8285931.1 tetratricopeptide repeat protein [Bacteroidota bacterium]
MRSLVNISRLRRIAGLGLLAHVLLSLVGCSGPEERLRRIETLRVALSERPSDRGVADSLAREAMAFVERYPQHARAPEMLFLAAQLYGGLLDRPAEAIGLHERLLERYPHSPQAENALFMIGYLAHNALGDTARARRVYEAFLARYPDSDLASGVRFELRTLGKSLDSLLQTIPGLSDSTP